MNVSTPAPGDPTPAPPVILAPDPPPAPPPDPAALFRDIDEMARRSMTVQLGSGMRGGYEARVFSVFSTKALHMVVNDPRGCAAALTEAVRQTRARWPPRPDVGWFSRVAPWYRPEKPAGRIVEEFGEPEPG